MDRKALVIALSRLPDHPHWDAAREQVRTPGEVAADLLLEAAAAGDITDRSVVDLGCGTGVFAIGAALLDAKRVLGIDVDADALALAERAAAAGGLAERVAWLGADVAELEPDAVREQLGGSVDTVVMNPPFGADRTSRGRGGDRIFLSLAFRLAPVVYSLHLASTERFLAAFARDSGFDVARAEVVDFPLPARHAHHRDAVRHVPVGVYRFQRAL